MIIMILHQARPMQSNFDNKKEIFNEVVTLLLLYMLPFFSDILPDHKLSH